MTKIAILITTFLRDELLYNTVQNIIDCYPKDSILLIGNQSYITDEEKLNGFSNFNAHIDNPAYFPIEYYNLPFDCGLSYARNFLIQKANEMNIPYILMMADSIQFLASYSFMPFIQFLELENNRGIVGFDLEGSKCPWEWLMELTTQGIRVTPSNKITYFGNLMFKEVDICRNIFLAKTSTMINLYDSEMKLGEHELAFLEYKKRGYKVYWTDALLFKKIISESNPQYNTYRKRFSEYRELLKKKLNITGWIIYSPEARKEINEFRTKNLS
jgi:hypothetical protein